MFRNGINIKAVGDICPGDKSILGLGVLNKTKLYGINFPFEKSGEFLRKSDLVIGNFEGLLFNNKHYSNDLTFCGLQGFANALFNAGFRVVNIANNHVFEHGLEIFLQTVEELENAGINICGLRSASNDFYSKPVEFKIKEKIIGFIGYNWVGTDRFCKADNYIAQSHDSLVNYTWKREKIRNLEPGMANRNVIDDIKKLKNRVDILILMTHWGYEFVSVPPSNVILEGHSFIDAGADLVIGSHPHVLQGMEKYKNGMIFYSMGNFIFDMRRKYCRRTVILDLNIISKFEIDYKYYPYFINRNYQPENANSIETKKIFTLLDRSSKFIISRDQEFLLDDNKIYKKYEKIYNLGKIIAIIDHFLALRKNPKLFFLIGKKSINFLNILVKRLSGEKIRW